MSVDPIRGRILSCSFPFLGSTIGDQIGDAVPDLRFFGAFLGVFRISRGFSRYVGRDVLISTKPL